MTRAILVSLGLALALLWSVGLTDGSTWWLVWLDGIGALLAFLMTAAIGEKTGAIAAATGPGVVGTFLGALFVAGLVAHASAWLVWFTLAFAGGSFALSGLIFVVRTIGPKPYSRTPMTAH